MKMLASFSKPQDAHLLVARLEDSGVAAYVRDEHMVGLDWLASNAVGGVKVDVADEDFERALEVMKEGDANWGRPAVAPGPRKLSRYVWIFVFSCIGTFLLVWMQGSDADGSSQFLTPAVAGVVFGVILSGMAAILRI